MAFLLKIKMWEVILPDPVLANKIVMMHRVALCLLLESTLEGQNWLLWCVSCWHPIKPKWERLAFFMLKISLLFIIQVIWLNVITINCALPNYDPMSEALIVSWLKGKWIKGNKKFLYHFEILAVVFELEKKMSKSICG